MYDVFQSAYLLNLGKKLLTRQVKSRNMYSEDEARLENFQTGSEMTSPRR